jgi:hypothetical protein
MVPNTLRPLFWDINLSDFEPLAYPDYTIFRVLEYGDDEAVAWLKETFSSEEIRRVIRSERRLSRKSANFGAVIYGIPEGEVAALMTGPMIPDLKPEITVQLEALASARGLSVEDYLKILLAREVAR